MNRYRYSSLSLIILFIIGSLVAANPVHAATMSTPANSSTDIHHVIVSYSSPQGRDAILKKSTEVHQQYDSVQAIAATLTQADLESLEVHPGVNYIESNSRVTLASQQFKAAAKRSIQTEMQEWSFRAIQPDLLWNEGYTGKGIKVAVIDTGISSHTELSLSGGVSVVDYTSSYADDNGHGTHVAGIIAARNDNKGIVGIAPDVQLYAVKALNQQGEGTLSDVMRAIKWAIDNDMDIINISFITEEQSNTLESLLAKAYNQGIVIVGSVGNDGAGRDTVRYPAKYDSVIAVTAIDNNNSKGSFSSTGAATEIAAPGVDVISTWLNQGYAVANGTSQASPHVTGMLALLKQKYPEMTSQQLRKELRKYALDIGAPGRDEEYGYGAVTFSKQLDTEPPAEVTEIRIIEQEQNRITIGWSNPADTDLEEINVYMNGQLVTVLSGNYYTAERLTSQTRYSFLLQTVDSSGNVSVGRMKLATTQPGGTASATDKQAVFRDTSSHWARETIRWASDLEIIKGYQDGTFRPNSLVSEAEFTAMLIRTFIPELYDNSDSENFLHWSDPFYAKSAELNYPVLGAHQLALRNQPIQRTKVAELIVSARGLNYSGDHATRYLLYYGLAEGNASGQSLISSFQGEKTLTRAEAVQFIRNLHDFGTDTLKERPAAPSAPIVLLP